MFLPVDEPNQVTRLALLMAVKSPPLAVRRQRSFRPCRFAAVISFCPFLFLQKPGVRPPGRLGSPSPPPPPPPPPPRSQITMSAWVNQTPSTYRLIRYVPPCSVG